MKSQTSKRIKDESGCHTVNNLFVSFYFRIIFSDTKCRTGTNIYFAPTVYSMPYSSLISKAKKREVPTLLMRKSRTRAMENLAGMKDRELAAPDFKPCVRAVATPRPALEP